VSEQLIALMYMLCACVVCSFAVKRKPRLSAGVGVVTIFCSARRGLRKLGSLKLNR